METESDMPVGGGDLAASSGGKSYSGGHQEAEREHSRQQHHQEAGSSDSSLGKDYRHESTGEAIATENQNGLSKSSSNNNRGHSSSVFETAHTKEQQKEGDAALKVNGEEDDNRKSSTKGGDGSQSCDQNAVNPPQKVEDITPELIRRMEERYAAYVRTDIYGKRGKGHLPFKNKLSLCVALVTIVPVRVIFITLVMLMYYNYFLICKICTLFRKEGEEEGEENYGHLTGVRKKVITVMGRWLARALLFGMGFYHIKKKNQGTSDVMQRLRLGLGQEEGGVVEQSRGGGAAAAVVGDRPCAIVSNHVSYLDILYHMSSSFPSFVAKKSVSQMPFIGLLSKCMGCVYVQRESKTPNSKGVSTIVTQRLQKTRASASAQIFLLFPEGTTTNGEYILPFKTGAFLAGAPVQPMLLKYPYKHFNPAWDTINGYLHVIIMLCQFVNHLEVTTLPSYYPSAKERADPTTFAANVRTVMAEEGNLTKVNIGLYEKRIYHSSLAGKIFTRSESNLT